MDEQTDGWRECLPSPCIFSNSLNIRSRPGGWPPHTITPQPQEPHEAATEAEASVESRAPTRSPGDAEAGPGGGGSLARLVSHSDGTVCVQVLCTLHSCDHDGVCTDLAPGTRSRAGAPPLRLVFPTRPPQRREGRLIPFHRRKRRASRGSSSSPRPQIQPAKKLNLANSERYTPGLHQAEPGGSWLLPKSPLPSKDELSTIKCTVDRDGNLQRDLGHEFRAP